MNNCLNVTQVTQPNNPQLASLGRKAFNKSFENFCGTQKAKQQKSVSPKRASAGEASTAQGRKSQKVRKTYANYNKLRNESSDRKNKSQVYSGSSQKQMSKLADLNFFIKSIEKDISQQQLNNKKSNSSTPNALLRKVEDQMKAYGYDKNNSSNPNIAMLLSNIEAHNNSAENLKKSIPKLKILALKEALYNSI